MLVTTIFIERIACPGASIHRNVSFDVRIAYASNDTLLLPLLVIFPHIATTTERKTRITLGALYPIIILLNGLRPSKIAHLKNHWIVLADKYEALIGYELVPEIPRKTSVLVLVVVNIFAIIHSNFIRSGEYFL